MPNTLAERLPAIFVSLRSISRRFGGVRALQGVSLNLRQGEIHGLAGENGCGKSTLIKILAGVYPPDQGEICVAGQAHQRLHPVDALRLGIQVIFQDFCLFPNLTVAENIAISTHIQRRRRLVRQCDFDGIAAEAIAALGVKLDLRLPVSSLSVGGQQLVAIARALPHATRLLIMDEPTAALTHREIERLFKVVRGLKARGVGVLLVSHKVPEILSMSDCITVLRNGRVVRTGPAATFTPTALVESMTGRSAVVQSGVPVRRQVREVPRLRVHHLTVRRRLHDVTFQVQRGEIVGLTGRLGSGRADLARALFGLLRVDGGDIWLDEEKITRSGPRAALAAGMAYVPEDRLREGLFLVQSVSRNLVASRLPRVGGRCGWLSPRHLSGMAVEWVGRLGIRTPDVDTPVENLSGGNQQKVVLARWLACGASVLLLNRPTAGVDVAAKAEIHRDLREWAGRGMSILLISDDLPELLELSHRLLLFHEGRIVEEFAAGALDESTLMDRLEVLP